MSLLKRLPQSSKGLYAWRISHQPDTAWQAVWPHDGIVNIFAINLISSNAGSIGSSAAAVPEPATWLMVLPVAVACLLVRTRRLNQGRYQLSAVIADHPS